jgi:hypothetical protein
MIQSDRTATINDSRTATLKPSDFIALLQGDILLATRPHRMFGGAVTAQMYLPIARSQVWAQLTDYTRWVQYFPDINCSEILESNPQRPHRGHRLYQAACKTFLMFTAQVEIHLRVFENLQRQIRFRMERGSFRANSG